MKHRLEGSLQNALTIERKKKQYLKILRDIHESTKNRSHIYERLTSQNWKENYELYSLWN